MVALAMYNTIILIITHKSFNSKINTDTDNPLVSGSGVDASEPEEPLTAANAAAAFQKRWPYYDEWFCINQ